MFNWFKSRRARKLDALNSTIRAIARQIDDTTQFRAAASNASARLGPDAIDSLSKLFHSPTKPPEGFGPLERGLGAWLAAWQFAIFEIFYNFGEDSLPLLRKVAYGDYDWIQGNAIEVLCRLAARGVQRNAILDELKREFPHLRHEAQLYAVKPLLSQTEENPTLAAVLDELAEIEEYRETVAELTYVDPDPENITNEDLQGTILFVELRDEEKWNNHIVGEIRVTGLNYFSFDECNGNARLGVTDRTRLLRVSEGTLQPIRLSDFQINDRVALGHYDTTEKTDPVTVYPESITRLSD